MKKIFEGVTRITTSIEFEIIMKHIDMLISEATEGGFFSNLDESNEYTQEIARLGKIGARYEDEFLNLSISRNQKLKKTEKIFSVEKRHYFDEVYSGELC